jgi:hypothetical protein
MSRFAGYHQDNIRRICYYSLARRLGWVWSVTLYTLFPSQSPNSACEAGRMGSEPEMCTARLENVNDGPQLLPSVRPELKFSRIHLTETQCPPHMRVTL